MISLNSTLLLREQTTITIIKSYSTVDMIGKIAM